MGRVGVVDDNEMLRDSMAQTLCREDHVVVTFGNPIEALEAIKTSSFDCIITDLKMPGMDGIKFMRQLRALGCDASVIMMTAFGTVATAVEAMKLGAFEYIQKPFEADRISLLVDRAVQHSLLRSENEALKRSLTNGEVQEMIGRTPAMQALLDTIKRVAPSDNTVLIQGDSGTGKEMIAREIHRNSSRADRPMLCLNCAALSANLLESELFGHERGAFTGADRLRKGRFELADGGTLLLDEVSEIPLGLQAKLLRVLQEQQFERVGSSVTRSVDVRVIAITNRNLADCVVKKRFREDLYFRMSVLPISVPPLRERVDDIGLLIEHFLRRAAGKTGMPMLGVDASAMRLMQNYDWPGNVRELENLCERASVLVTDGILTESIIAPWLSGALSTESFIRSLRHGHILEDIERRLIEKTLADCNGHRAKTAAALGIGLRTLGLKLKRWRDEARAKEVYQMAG